MNVLLVSQCDKRALVETRRILDQFAERRGDRTWQTPITLEGLKTLRKLLRASARKNTAVACHWIRGHDHSELMWLVGDATRFNSRGAVPTNWTRSDIRRTRDENDWHNAELISLLTRMAALFHDFGKANAFFQRKLKKNERLADPYRHEWISLRLFAALAQGRSDQDWLQTLSQIDTGWSEASALPVNRDGIDPSLHGPFDNLPPLARMIGWLIVSHHRLPAPPKLTTTGDWMLGQRLWTALDSSWCSPRTLSSTDEQQACWDFTAGLPYQSKAWRNETRKIADRLLAQLPKLNAQEWTQNLHASHLARCVLILSDHWYSSQPKSPRTRGDVGFPLWANTTADSTLKQALDDHLIGVGKSVASVLHDLPRLDFCLPRIARRRSFTARTRLERFRWQDRAFDLAAGVREHAAEHGFFGVSMASTGAGKTLANGRIMYALANPERGARFCIALGLRTLTLQTGDAMRQRLLLDSDDLAVMIGSSAVRALHQASTLTTDQAGTNGSESAAPLFDASIDVRYEGELPQGTLGDWMSKDLRLLALLAAPVLVCTIDHLMPACESTRGGHQIAPILRLLTSDLVLDEPDDFDIADLPAVTRLVHFAGLMGSRVLLSSATLPPDLVRGLYAAYLAGRSSFQVNRGRPGLIPQPTCAWFDEFGASSAECADEDSFAAAHRDFAEKRKQHIHKRLEIRRQASIAPVNVLPARPESVRKALARLIQPHVFALHQAHHSIDPKTGKAVSFGLLRIANIDPLIDIAKALAQVAPPDDTVLHICVYHSRFPLVARSHIENALDRALNRQEPDAVFGVSQIRAHLDGSTSSNHVFLVIASPVAEVGRDHCYDWAIVEPSSMRSIIQLAGRVRRHRAGACASANIILLGRNRRSVEAPGQCAFLRPGFETVDRFKLTSHELSKLLLPEDIAPLTSASRICARDQLKHRANLVDLEHYRMQLLMLDSADQKERNVRRWWRSSVSLTAHEQRQTPFRAGPVTQTYFAIPEEGETDITQWYLLSGEGIATPADDCIKTAVPPSLAVGVNFWATTELSSSLESLAVAHGEQDSLRLAQRYASIQLPVSDADSGKVEQWLYCPWLGIRRDQR